MIATLVGAAILAGAYAALYAIGWVVIRKIGRPASDPVYWVVFPFCGSTVAAFVFVALTVCYKIGTEVLK